MVENSVAEHQQEYSNAQTAKSAPIR